jgi:hypothetical protein
MSTPTFDSLAEKAINSLPTWGKHFLEAGYLIALRQKIASVEASGWAFGKTQQEIETEAKRILMEGE